MAIELEKNNLGKPCSPEVEINSEEVKIDKPQAWEFEGNWYYNWEGAIKESSFLNKKIPTKSGFISLINEGIEFNGNEKYFEYSNINEFNYFKDSLNLDLSGARRGKSSNFYGQGERGCYWANDSEYNKAVCLIFDKLGFTLGLDYKDFAFSVRCIKNNNIDND